MTAERERESKKLEISSAQFTVIFSLIITVLNFSFFNYIYQNSNFIFTAIIFIVFFTILLFVFTILFIPFLTKILAILLLFCGTVCVYFMQSYNIVIDEINSCKCHKYGFY